MKKIASVLIALCFLLIPFNVAAPQPSKSQAYQEEDTYQGYPEGVSWKPMVPIKNSIFVNYDGESYTDDYAYLAAVPAAVFYSKSFDQIYSSPLLFMVECW